ncbi:hypothetical protein QJS04_geneDACA020567 [Acorus gramineus]|uniref:Uncharacterized protein n=1 Tax=Acorus gramineus TaxID=55184 RepID=A0AAV9A168_ACOGR|nr:hypothetical protein QJS04_geneDACA020567 [Acorus gramineus]
MSNMKQPLVQTELPQQQSPPPCRHKDDDLSWMPPIGAIFLIFNSIFAIYRSRDDIYTVTFIIAANIALAFLFWSIRAHENAAKEAKKKHKISIWAMATLLNVGFAWKMLSVDGEARIPAGSEWLELEMLSVLMRQRRGRGGRDAAMRTEWVRRVATLDLEQMIMGGEGLRRIRRGGGDVEWKEDLGSEWKVRRSQGGSCRGVDCEFPGVD